LADLTRDRRTAHGAAADTPAAAIPVVVADTRAPAVAAGSPEAATAAVVAASAAVVAASAVAMVASVTVASVTELACLAWVFNLRR